MKSKAGAGDSVSAEVVKVKPTIEKLVYCHNCEKLNRTYTFEVGMRCRRCGTEIYSGKKLIVTTMFGREVLKETHDSKKKTSKENAEKKTIKKDTDEAPSRS